MLKSRCGQDPHLRCLEALSVWMGYSLRNLLVHAGEGAVYRLCLSSSCEERIYFSW